MARGLLIGLLALGALGAGWIRPGETVGAKRVIGQTAQVEIPEAGLAFLGRVDTGAATTSLHAESVQVEENEVSFVLTNRAGQRVQMRAPIAKTSRVRNAEGSEKRISVELTVCHEGLAKRILANLNDRSGLTYALLLGRNWLEDDFVVDVSREPLQPPRPEASEPRDAEVSPGLVSR